MSQHDYNIANQTFSATRTDLNNALGAVATNNAGNSAPSTTYANQWWFDSDGNTLYMRNKDNDAWVTVLTIGATSDDVESLTANVITEGTSATGVTVDGMLIKDGGFVASKNCVISTTGNETTLEMISTDADASSGPRLSMNRQSGSPADGDDLGKIFFFGKNDAAEDQGYAEILAEISDASDGTEDGRLVFNMRQAGATVEAIRVEGSNGVVVNEGSADVDFRVESNGDENMLFVDGGNNAVGIGNNSPLLASGRGLVVHGGASIARVELRNNTSGGAATDGMFLTYSGNDAFVGNREAGTIQFWNNGSERMRIESDGGVVIGDTSTSRMLGVKAPSGFSQYTVDFENASSSAPYGILNRYSGAAPDSASSYQFLTCDDTSATRLRIDSDGDVVNHDNSYGAISDERIKQDIRDSSSQWNDIKAVKVRNFKKKDDVRQYGDNAWEQIGVIAQELEVVSPKLIRKHNPSSSDILSSSEFGTLYTSDDAETQDAVLYTSDDQEVIDGDKNVGDIKTESTKQIGEVKTIAEQVKSVNYSVLYMKAIKALQEAMTKIEDLETRVTTLEG